MKFCADLENDLIFVFFYFENEYYNFEAKFKINILKQLFLFVIDNKYHNLI